MVTSMGSESLSQDDWEAILHAPFRVYTLVASADGPPVESQYRHLGEAILAGRESFGEGTVGRTMVDTLVANQDVLWAGYQASGRSPKDGLKRAVKALRQVPEGESAAVRAWLVALGITIGEVRRTVGEATISESEQLAIRDLTKWLDSPIPTPG